MKSRGKSIWLLTTALVIGPNIIGRADSVTVKKELNAQYAKISAAIKALNVKAVMAFDTPDYKAQIDPKTTLTRAEVEKAYQKQIDGTQEITEMSFTIRDVKLEGVQAVATVQTKEVILLGTVQQLLSSSIQQERHTFIAKQTALDTWVKTAVGWRLKYEQVISKEATLDGKPLIHTTESPAENTHPKPDESKQPDSKSNPDGSQRSVNPPK